MPGKIIAQMAIAPDKKTNQSASGVSAGTAMVIQKARPAPTSNAGIWFQCLVFRCFCTTQTEAKTSPKKKDQMGMGWFSSKKVSKRAKLTKLMAIPASRGSKNPASACFQAAAIPLDLRVPKRERFMLLMAFNKRS